MDNSRKKIILTGDRPTGPLHLGHYIGSLQNRVKLQNEYEQYVLIADAQALTDNFDNPQKVHDNVYEVMLDYLAVGLDPKISTIFIQSMIPEIAELTVYYLNLVTVERLKRNPTVKEELKTKKFAKNITAGFLMYPVSQTADITAFGANLVPVGEDQLPMIEQAIEIVRKFNKIYQNVLVEPKALVSETPRLVGLDGKSKMSKSLGNAIYLSDSEAVLKEKIKKMYTDPGHIHVSDPGRVEGNAVFVYLDAFAQDKKYVAELKSKYKKGGLGDVAIKQYLFEVLNDFMDPIRKRRQEYAKDPAQVMKILEKGTVKAREKASQTLARVKEAMKINYFE